MIRGDGSRALGGIEVFARAAKRAAKGPALQALYGLSFPPMPRRLRFTRNLGRALPAPAPPRKELGYVRFEHASEVVGGVAHGPFSYLDDAEEILTGADREKLDALTDWFRKHLDEPERLVPFRDVGERRARRRRTEPSAQCWFRADATTHIAKARELVAVLARAGFAFVERRSARRPGKLCAEDDAQIAVVPYRDRG